MSLAPKVLSARRVEYIPAPYAGVNKSGCTPVGDRVLVRADIAAGESGGIKLPDEVRERAQMTATSGVIVDMGDDAFFWNADRTRPFNGEKPVKGTRVYYDRYAGKVILGDDNVEYTLMDDKCIGGFRKPA